MAETTTIEWADMTFNPWEGCAKISAGCKGCYAQTQHQHHYSSLNNEGNPGTCWGVNAPRLARSDANWRGPVKWNQEAKEKGIQSRVFCASMADVFEQQSPTSRLLAETVGTVPTGKEKTREVRFVDLDKERLRLFMLISKTPHLIYMLLTKRPEHIMTSIAAAGQLINYREEESELGEWLREWEDGNPPLNVWLGTSVEDQPSLDARMQWLLTTPAVVHFVSNEPAIGPTDFTRARVSSDIFRMRSGLTGELLDEVTHTYSSCFDGPDCIFPYALDWLITGGESGAQARPMHPKWALQTRDQCQQAGVAFFFKQWGEWGPTQAIYDLYPESTTVIPARLGYKFQDMEPERIFEYPGQWPDYTMWKLGKKQTGRRLDGQIYDQMPVVELSKEE